MIKCRIIFVLVSLGFFQLSQLTTAQEVFAYIDPGAGSYIFQLIIAGVMAVVFSFNQLRHKIKGFIRGFLEKKDRREPCGRTDNDKDTT